LDRADFREPGKLTTTAAPTWRRGAQVVMPPAAGVLSTQSYE